jgi:hypothetical protein
MPANSLGRSQLSEQEAPEYGLRILTRRRRTEQRRRPLPSLPSCSGMGRRRGASKGKSSPLVVGKAGGYGRVTTREAHGTAASDGRREWLPRRARVGLRAAMDLWARKQGATGPMIRFFFQKKSRVTSDGSIVRWRKFHYELLQWLLQYCCSIKIDNFSKSQGGPPPRSAPVSNV